MANCGLRIFDCSAGLQACVAITTRSCGFRSRGRGRAGGDGSGVPQPRNMSQSRARVQALTDLTKWYASFASSTHDLLPAGTAIHSFINRPWPGSKYSTLPEATSSSARALGSLTTNWPFEDIIAKILPVTLRAPEPNPFPVPRLTCAFLANAFTTGTNLGSSRRSTLWSRARGRGIWRSADPGL